MITITSVINIHDKEWKAVKKRYLPQARIIEQWWRWCRTTVAKIAYLNLNNRSNLNTWSGLRKLLVVCIVLGGPILCLQLNFNNTACRTNPPKIIVILPILKATDRNIWAYGVVIKTSFTDWWTRTFLLANGNKIRVKQLCIVR